MSATKKSTRHSKLTGDFGEALLLNWLSKYGYECARVDHTGIDLIARDLKEKGPWGISVKCRSRYDGTENNQIRLPVDGFQKAREACEAFSREPYYGIIIDGAQKIRCYLLSLERLEQIVGKGGDNRYWRMNAEWLAEYERDPQIMRFELDMSFCYWAR